MLIDYVNEADLADTDNPQALVLSLWGWDESPLLLMLGALKRHLIENDRTLHKDLALFPRERKAILDTLDAAFMAIAVQDPLWKEATSRISGTQNDFATWTSMRTENRLLIPSLLREVLKATPKLTLVVFEGAIGCPNVRTFMAPLAQALKTYQGKVPRIVVAQV
jgi:hypothetical protein